MTAPALLVLVASLLLAACSEGAAPAAPVPPAAPSAPAGPPTAALVNGEQVVELTVTTKGYEPSPIRVTKGVPVKLVVKRVTDRTCAKELIVDGKVDLKLPLNETVTATFTPDATGELKYGCAMDKMIAGVLVVE